MDTTNPANDPELDHAEHQWIADATECVACRVLGEAERAERKKYGDRAGATIHTVRLVERAPRVRGDGRVRRAEPKP